MIPKGEGWTARPLNCAADLGAAARCPNCKQVHLRAGYCQALDPINAAKYPEFHPAKRDKMPSRHGADTVTDNDKTLTQQGKREKPVTDKRCDVTDNGENVTDNGAAGVLSVTECAECGAMFHPKRVDARYCSQACRITAHRKQKSPQ
jgi:hypothetical protein